MKTYLINFITAALAFVAIHAPPAHASERKALEKLLSLNTIHKLRELCPRFLVTENTCETAFVTEEKAG